jgi:hypothetical protein
MREPNSQLIEVCPRDCVLVGNEFSIRTESYRSIYYYSLGPFLFLNYVTGDWCALIAINVFSRNQKYRESMSVSIVNNFDSLTNS